MMSNAPDNIKLYPPGSDIALEHGCTCAVLDNAHGLGAYGGAKDENGQVLYWMNLDCPLHGSEAMKQWENENE